MNSISRNINMSIQNNNMNQAIGILLIFAIFMGMFFAGGVPTKADTLRYATVNSATVNVRKAPGTENTRIGIVVKGSIITIDGDAEDSNGSAWYHMSYGDIVGYVKASTVTLCEYTVAEDAEFEAYMNEQGFPESYKERLRIIHTAYPKWELKAFNTGLEWDTVIENEMVEGRSLVSGSSVSSWKSIEGSAYDWETSTWKTGWDSGSWVLASEEILSYFMDPRNFLTTEAVFQFLDQGYNESQTVEGVKAVAGSSFISGTGEELDGSTFSYPEVIYNAGVNEKVNPYVLASMIIQELGSSGGSLSISGTYEGYEGYYNYYNIGAYKTDQFTSAIQRGLWFAAGGNNGATTYGRPWNSRQIAIAGGANFYYTSYISAGQKTLYLKKYNVQGSNMYKHQYMTNVDGAFGESISLANGYSAAARDEALIFYIPVYANMPEKPCLAPTVDGSPNNRLISITVGEYELTPAFSMDTLEYSLIVTNDINSVDIVATAADTTASVSGAGTVSLAVGVNSFDITVTAENGDIRVYSLVISREAGDEPEVTVVTDYTLAENIITGIALSTSVSDLNTAITVENATIVVTDSQGTAKTSSDLVGTTDIVNIIKLDSTLYASYDVLIYGDVNGDGKITTSDLIKVRNHILGDTLLEGSFVSAADVSKDSQVLTGDLIKVRNHILGSATITQ